MERYTSSIPGLFGRALDRLGELVERRRIIPSPSVRVEERARGTALHLVPPLVAQPPRQMWFQVREVLRDYLLCHPVDTRLWLEYGQDPASYILVAKPPVLRTEWLAGGSGAVGGFNFENYGTEPNQHRYRLHDSFTPEKDLEEIYPFYDVGSLILALEIRAQPPLEWNLLGVAIHTGLGLVTAGDITPASPPTDTIPAGTQVNWLDLNLDARRWASLGLLIGSRVATGDVTITVGGMPYTDPNSLRVAGYEI